MKLDIEIDENELKELVYSYFRKKLGMVLFDPKDVVIEVKSKQNYKSEWEVASFRGRVQVITFNEKANLG